MSPARLGGPHPVPEVFGVLEITICAALGAYILDLRGDPEGLRARLNIAIDRIVAARDDPVMLDKFITQFEAATNTLRGPLAP